MLRYTSDRPGLIGWWEARQPSTKVTRSY